MPSVFATELARWGPQRDYAAPGLRDAQAYCRRLALTHYENFSVASLFVHLLFPGEGSANLNRYFSLAISYLNTTDDVNFPLDFSTVPVSNTPGSVYDTHIRGMVAALMTLQRFQEQ